MTLSNCRKGQSVVEYILLVVAVIIVMLSLHAKNGSYHRAIEHGILNGSLQMLKNVESEVRF